MEPDFKKAIKLDWKEELGVICPVCGTPAVYDIFGDHCNYCPKCGQKLDWGDIDQS